MLSNSNFGRPCLQLQTPDQAGVLANVGASGIASGFATICAGTNDAVDTRSSFLNVMKNAAQSANAPLKEVDLLVNAHNLVTTETRPSRTDWSLSKLGRQALAKGNLLDAMQMFHKQLQITMSGGKHEDVAEAATDLAYLLLLCGEQGRAGVYYAKALQEWKNVSSVLAGRSPRVVSAFAVFLYDYGAYLTVKNNFVVAARAKRRLKSLADRFSAFTVYSALAKRLRERGQMRESRMVLDQASSGGRNRAVARYNTEILHRLKTHQGTDVFLPPLNLGPDTE